MDFLNKSNAVDIIYLDLSKAFDTVPRGKLLAKLKRTGIDAVIMRWIRNQLA